MAGTKDMCGQSDAVQAERRKDGAEEEDSVYGAKGGSGVSRAKQE